MARKRKNSKRPREGPCNQKKKKRPRMNYTPILSQVNEGKTSNIASIYVFGDNGDFQLGIGDTVAETMKPRVALEDQNILDLQAGSLSNTVIVTSKHSDGRSVYTWGQNDDSVLGHDGNGETPEVIPALEGKFIVQACSGEYHQAVLSSTGHVYSWGNYKVKTADPDNGAVQEQFIGFKDGRDADNTQKEPEFLEELEDYFIVQIASTFNSTIALTDRGDIFEWGDLRWGSRGNAMRRHHTDKLVPKHVVLSTKAIAVYSGGYHKFALGADGLVYCWGLDSEHQLGTGLKRPRNRDLPTKAKAINAILPDIGPNGEHPVKMIACGSHHTLVLTREGELYAFGRNKYHQLGIGSDEMCVVEPTRVDLDDVASISAGEHHSAALTADGDLYTWGFNEYYQLGYKTEGDGLVPKKVNFKQNILAVSCGASHTALVVDSE
eukprot:TRINITY_DN11509_c0_g1_i1.p1 TRINITY_DN11509_c0_g1~~TRINITY_DN11509_c0_g1_i1.p1  ORF type:complete len:444 (+),score=122.86 TRINITY_DN11509_c0_g1_i1:26-1333(+)